MTDGPGRRRATFDPNRSQMDIRLKSDGTPVLFTWYKGHMFYGWITQDIFARAEADGVLSWDERGEPIIKGAAPAPESEPETRP